jgi:hypothetical protein
MIPTPRSPSRRRVKYEKRGGGSHIQNYFCLTTFNNFTTFFSSISSKERNLIFLMAFNRIEMNHGGHANPLVKYGRSFAGFLLVLLVFCGGCAGRNTLTDLTGTWGGEHIGIIVSEKGATLDYDCAHGTMNEPLTPDENGKFEAVGVHILEHGGPILLGDIPMSILQATRGSLRVMR